MDPIAEDRLIVAGSLSAALSAGARGARYLAGGTWLMRAPIRGEVLPAIVVALGRIAELARIEIGQQRVVLGSAVTHEALADTVAGISGLEALATAAGDAANPNIRRMATLGGNLCTLDFPAADLVPALLALDAEISLETAAGPLRLAMQDFLARREQLLPDALVTSVTVPRGSARSAHVRLPLRRAGDYPVAIVSMAVDHGSDGMVRSARIAVGSVEQVARRWERLETALVGRPLDPHKAAEAARAGLSDFAPRDGIEAQGWYRTEVLPALVGRAIGAIAAAGQR